MDRMLERYNRAVRWYDRELYVLQPKVGGMCYLLRRDSRLMRYDLGGETLWASVPNHKQVLTLSDTWSPKGVQVEWGLEPLLGKLREIDSHNDQHDGGVLARLERQDRKFEEAKRKESRSLHEAMAYEAHGVFRKAFKDINTANFSKSAATKGMRRNGYL